MPWSSGYTLRRRGQWRPCSGVSGQCRMLLVLNSTGGSDNSVTIFSWQLDLDNSIYTFIIRTTVLSAIMTSTVYSNEGDATKCHSLYWKVCLFWGMYRVIGLALMAKSMQALWRRKGGLVIFIHLNMCVMIMSWLCTSFFSRLHSWIILSPCSWNVMMIKATKMLTKKNGKTTKYTT